MDLTWNDNKPLRPAKGRPNIEYHQYIRNHDTADNERNKSINEYHCIFQRLNDTFACEGISKK